MAVGEQSLVADAMQILGQHVRQEAPNKLMNKFRKLGFVEYNGGLSVQSSLLNVVPARLTRIVIPTGIVISPAATALLRLSNFDQTRFEDWSIIYQRAERR
jgi:hypothetical protein